MTEPNDFTIIVADAAQTPERRLEALATAAQELGRPVRRSGESNNHIHTCYSFSPYTPAGAALAARLSGLDVAGSVDHDSYAAAEEMRAACALLGIGAVTGFELRVSLKKTASRFPEKIAKLLTERKLNNPDSSGIIYITIQGVPAQAREEVASFLAPVRKARYGRTERMVARANALLGGLGLPGIDFEKDVVATSKFAEGGTITERHLLAAVSRSILTAVSPGPALTAWLEGTLGMQLNGSQRRTLSDPTDPHLTYDLLGALKAGFLDRIFIQPEEECVDVSDAVEFATHIGAIPAYAYLGDVAESPTGDKKAEKFEDEILDELVPALREIGFSAITYMPPRNTLAQLMRLQGLCERYGFMEISGVDINQPRQSFNCPELRLPAFKHLDDATWAMVAHEALSAVDRRFGLFSHENPLSRLSLRQRITIYAQAGRRIDLSNPRSIEETADTLSQEKNV